MAILLESLVLKTAPNIGLRPMNIKALQTIIN